MRPTDHEMELEPGPPNPEDACPVCDKIDCECPPEPVFTLDHPLKHYFPAPADFPSVLESAENERRLKRNSHRGIVLAAILFLGLSVFTARGQDPVQTRSTMFGHPDFGNWLIIRRHDNDPNYHPNWTSIVTKYKPVVRKLPHDEWEIVFVSELTERLP